MKNGKKARAGHGEEGHGLSEAVDAGPPFLVHQQENGGDKGAGVADTNPPDKIDDGKAPRGRDADAPDADAIKEDGNGDIENEEEQERGCKPHEPPCG